MLKDKEEGEKSWNFGRRGGGGEKGVSRDDDFACLALPYIPKRKKNMRRGGRGGGNRCGWW